jgi:hypothetical protein
LCVRLCLYAPFCSRGTFDSKTLLLRRVSLYFPYFTKFDFQPTNIYTSHTTANSHPPCQPPWSPKSM